MHDTRDQLIFVIVEYCNLHCAVLSIEAVNMRARRPLLAAQLVIARDDAIMINYPSYNQHCTMTTGLQLIFSALLLLAIRNKSHPPMALPYHQFKIKCVSTTCSKLLFWCCCDLNLSPGSTSRAAQQFVVSLFYLLSFVFCLLLFSSDLLLF